MKTKTNPKSLVWVWSLNIQKQNQTKTEFLKFDLGLGLFNFYPSWNRKHPWYLFNNCVLK